MPAQGTQMSSLPLKSLTNSVKPVVRLVSLLTSTLLNVRGFAHGLRR